MEVRVYKSIAEIDENEWDSIVGRNRLICRHKYIEAVEKSQINDCRFFYPVVYEGKEIIAHTSCYFISTELDAFAQGATKKAIALMRRWWPGFFILRTLECGTPVAAGNTISFKEGVDRIAVLDLLCRTIERLARDIRVKIVLFRDFYDEELELFDYFTTLGYTKIHNLPSTAIEIKWKSFDEYLSALRSCYKWKIIHHIRKCQQDNISIHIIRSFSSYADAVEKLWMNVYNRAKEYKRERLTLAFFKNIDTYLGDRSAIILIRKEDIPIAFLLLLFDDDTLIPLFCGLDYAYNEIYGLYFNILCKCIETGITENMKGIDMGVTTLIPKKEIGAVVVPMNMYIKNFNPLFNKIIPKVFDMMTPKDTSGPRRVFKTSRENEGEKTLRKPEPQPDRVLVEIK